jgi:hypothetical protein
MHSKNSQISNFIKFQTLEAQFFRSDKRRDRLTDGRDDADSRFYTLANVSTKFSYERLWAMLLAVCDVCTGVVGESGKN